MSNPTDSDRATAAKILSDWHEESTRNRNGIFDFKGGPTGRTFLRDAIAAALAAEREACAKVAEDESVQWKAILASASRRAKNSELLSAVGYQGDPDAEVIEAQTGLNVAAGLATAIRNRGN